MTYPARLVGCIAALFFVFAAPPALGQTDGEDDQEAQSVTLDEVLEEVEEENEEWEITEARIEQAQAARREARAELFPSVTASADLIRYSEPLERAGEEIRPQYDWGTSGQITVALFDGANYPLLSRSGELLEATRAISRWQRQTVTFEAAQAFYILAAAEEQVDIAERAVELREAQYERAQAMAEADLAVDLDVERADAQVWEARQEVIEAEAQLGQADDSLASLMAREPETTLRARVEEEAVESPPERAEIDNLETRPDFESFDHEIAAVEESKRAVWWSFLPTLELSANTHYGPGRGFTEVQGFDWSLSLQASWLLYDGGARYAQIDQFESQIREDRLEYEREMREARVGIRDAHRRWRSAAAAVEVAEEQVEAAEAAYESARARFDQGLDTNIDVIEASESLFRAETSLNQRTFEARIAAEEYRYLLGLIGQE
ncbi:MAG: TolC family protein [Persicimonas sp.]